MNAYELIQKETLTSLKSEGYLLRHKKSGARILLLKNEDDNKVFNIGFRTPPSNSTGVPHIMEHSVLCGSKNFPVKDPFVELVKGSLNTFLNAMTYPDKTLYPVASCNDKDFQNLMHIYMDAVFYPNIYEHEEIFRQEGWSYKLEDKDSDLEYNGVVYNEMKGAFSSPEGLLDRVILNSLFPDTSYSTESGGDPDCIPDLTYVEFLNFHRKYYHPSNSYIYLYGDMDMEEKLEWLDKEYLSHFDKIEVDSEIKTQKPFDEVRDLTFKYSIASDEPEEENTYLAYNKVIGTSLDEKLYVAFEILDYALLSAPGAPLKKALIDAGIGKDIMGYYDNGIKQPLFSIIAKNSDADKKAEFVKVIEDTLSDIVKNGMNKKAIEAGINYHEFRYREADFGSFPKGLMYGLQIFDSWLYDEEKPFIHMEAIPVFNFLRENINTGYFENLIKTYLLDNTHGSIITVEPERGRTARLDKKLADRLEAYKNSLSDEEIETLVKRTHDLEAYQEGEDRLEDIEKIPVLDRSDISKDIAPFFNEERDVSGVKMVYHDVDTNGIGYVNVMFDLSHIPEDKLVYAGLIQAVLGIIDTKEHEYGELFNEINLHTGGIGTSIELYADVTKVKEKQFTPMFEMKGKALYPKMDILFKMMTEILTESNLDDDKRLKEILDLVISKLQMHLQSSGHITSAMRALSYTSPQAKFKDDVEGIGYYRAVKEINDNFDTKKEELIANLKDIANKVFCKENMIVSYTSSTDGLKAAEDGVKSMLPNLYNGFNKDEKLFMSCSKKNEGFKTSSKVQYVSRSGNFMDKGVPYHGALQILKVILSYDYLWQNVRVKGGAYGCMSSFNRLGEGYFMSYRDPNLEKTNDTYEGVTDYLKNFKASDRDMNKYIIGTMSNIDRPMTPSVIGSRSMNLYMNNVSADMIKQERMEILNATQEDIRNLSKTVEAVLEDDLLCVIGGEDKIEENKDMFMNVSSLF